MLIECNGMGVCFLRIEDNLFSSLTRGRPFLDTPCNLLCANYLTVLQYVIKATEIKKVNIKIIGVDIP
jgi:hypothetical protein